MPTVPLCHLSVYAMHTQRISKCLVLMPCQMAWKLLAMAHMYLGFVQTDHGRPFAQHVDMTMASGKSAGHRQIAAVDPAGSTEFAMPPGISSPLCATISGWVCKLAYFASS